MSEIYQGYRPGSIGRIAELHATYYASQWNFGVFFEAKVATELSEFMVRYNPSRDAFWSVVVDGRIEGAITIDGTHAQDHGAHLRWFIMSEALRGQGWGKRLIDSAITFCKRQNYPSVYLWTFAGLGAARKLYESAGFVLVHEAAGQQWGAEVIEQKFTLVLE